MRTLKIAAHAAAILATLAAAGISFLLYMREYAPKNAEGKSVYAGASLLDYGCSEGAEAGSANCAEVLKSREAVIAGYPASFWGWFYYSSLLIWLVLIGRPSKERAWMHLLPLGVMAVGLCISAYLLYVMFFVIHHWCPWCVAAHALNLFTFLCLLVIAPGCHLSDLYGSFFSKPSSERGQPWGGSLYPPLRLCLATGLAIAALFGAGNMFHISMVYLLPPAREAKSLRAQVAHYRGQLEELASNPKKMVQEWGGSEQQVVSQRQDDPHWRKEGQKNFPLFIFSDFECPYCRDTAQFIFTKVQPLFDGYLRIVFKHYPINRDCNPEAKTRMHKYACTAAQAAESARMQLGNDAFWKVHDYFFSDAANVKALSDDDGHPDEVGLTAFAQRFGLNKNLLMEQIRSKEVADRIAEDAALGKSLGLTRTPHLVLYNHHVPSIAVRNLGFWKEIARLYWQSAGVPMPDHVKALLESADPGAPEPTDAARPSEEEEGPQGIKADEEKNP